jgi:hypothetical protein
MFEEFFLLEFNKYNSLFLINLQETSVNWIKVFELKNYFITLFQFTVSFFIRNYNIFYIKHSLYTIALQKITISANFLLIFIHLRCGGSSKQKLSDDKKTDKNNPKFLKCKIDIESV